MAESPPGPSASTHWLTRFLFLRLLGLVYRVAFLVVVLQREPLLGAHGLLPARTYEERKGGHLDVVVTERSRRAVGFAQALRVGEEMARHGFEPPTLPADELFLGKGGAHCMTCPVVVA